STWNLRALAPITLSYSVYVGTFQYRSPRNVFAGWFQDDWQPTSHLTLNLGLRYDIATNSFANDVVIQPLLPPGRSIDKKNFARRFGFVYSFSDRMVVRGGMGKFFGDIPFQISNISKGFSFAALPLILNDGRPDFDTNPFNGPPPTLQQVQSS